MSQRTSFPVSLEKFPIDNEYTTMFMQAEKLAVPVDWLLRTGINKYDTAYSLIAAEIVQPDHAGDIASALRVIYVNLFEVTGYVNRDIILYGLMDFIEDEYEHLSDDEKDRLVISIMMKFEVTMDLTQTLTIDSNMDIVRRIRESRFRESEVVTNKMLAVIRNYREAVDRADKSVSVINVSKYEITHNTMELLFDGIDSSMGMFIFDNVIMSERMVYFSFTDSNRKNFIKLFRGTELDREPSYNLAKLDKKRGNFSNNIQFVIWLGSGSVYTAAQQTFYYGTFDIEKGEMRFKIPVVVRGFETEFNSRSVEVIKNAFQVILKDSGAKIRSALPTGYVVEVNMYPSPAYSLMFNLVVLLHQIMINDMFRFTFFMDETVRPFAKKRRMEFYYIPFLSEEFRHIDDKPVPVKWSIARRTFSAEPPPEAIFTDPENIPPYFRVRIAKASTIKDAEMIIASICRALIIHVEVLIHDRLHVSRYYDSLFEEYDTGTFRDCGEEGATLALLERTIFSMKQEEESDITRLSPSREGTERILRLVRDPVLKKVFGPRYQMDCPGNSAPVVFMSEQEGETWLATTSWHKPPIPFPAPPSDTLFWFSGSNANFSYPNIVENSDPATMGDYYYVPKCTAHDPKKGPKTSLYSRIYVGSTAVGEITTIERVTDKLLGAHEEGKLPIYMDKLFGDNVYSKLGIVNANNPNSLIHCVMYAIGDREYMSRYSFSRERTDTPRELDSFVDSFRRELVKDSEDIACVKQELFDVSDDVIREKVRDVRSFFDPRLFFRLLEERFKINIFTFTNVDVEASQDARLEIPRYRVLHSHPQRLYRKTVIIFKNKGPKRTERRIQYPHCELVVIKSQLSVTTQYDTTESHYFILGRTLTNVTVKPPAPGIDSYGAYNSIYDTNYETMFGKSILSQRIDAHGHVRSFNILWSKKITVFVPPSQPLRIVQSNDVFRVTIHDAIKFVGADPYSASISIYNDEETINGLWFSFMGVEEFLHIPVITSSITSYPSIIEGSPSPAIDSSVGKNITARIRKMTKTLDIIKQIIIWVLDTYRTRLVSNGDAESEDSIENFITSYFSPSSAGVTETSNFYDLCTMEQRFPLLYHERDCLRYIREKCSSLVSGSLRFVMVNDKFMAGVLYFVRTYFRESFRGIFAPKRYIEGFFTAHTDFKHQRGVEIFVGKEEFASWINFKKGFSREDITILTSINLSHNLVREPIILENEGLISIIQNVQGDDYFATLGAAITVHQAWSERGVNLGYFTKSAVEDPHEENVAVYGISPSGNLVPLYEPRYPDEPFANVLMFAGVQDFRDARQTNVKYAAILDI